MVRRWSYITSNCNVNIKNIVNPAGVKLFKSCVRVKNVTKRLTHLARRKYFTRRLKNSLTLFLVLSSRWLLDFLVVKKNSRAWLLVGAIYNNLPTASGLKSKSNLPFAMRNFPCSKSLQLPSYITITPRAYDFGVNKFTSDQLKFFSFPSQLVISLLECYRRIIANILITNIVK